MRKYLVIGVILIAITLIDMAYIYWTSSRIFAARSLIRGMGW